MQLHNAKTVEGLRAPRAIVRNNYLEIGKVNIALGSISNGAYVLNGLIMTHLMLTLSTIIEVKYYGDFDPVHPGEILKADFLLPLEMSQYALAKHLNIS